MILNGETACCYTYNAANELTDEMSDQGEVDYAYDGRGNCIRKTVEDGYSTYFAYNSRNLIAGITSDDPAFTTPNAFTYNALGQRISKTDSAGTTYYVWDGLHILLEHDGAGTVTRRYTYGHEDIEGVGGLIDVEDTASGDHYFYHLDQVGGVRDLTDDAQAIVKTYEFSPFGRILEDTGSAPNDFTFPATYIGLTDLPALSLSPLRLYDAATGRYCSRDEITRIPDYVALVCSPLRALDASGADPFCPPGAETKPVTGGYMYRTSKQENHVVPNGCGPVGSLPLGIPGTAVPNRPFGFNFKSACDNHDVCYGSCGRPKGGCDDRFFVEMIAHCFERTKWVPHRFALCVATATAYYKAVGLGGSDASEKGQDDHCHWEPCCKRPVRPTPPSVVPRDQRSSPQPTAVHVPLPAGGFIPGPLGQPGYMAGNPPVM